MRNNRWDAKHKRWHSVVTIFLRAVWSTVLLVLGLDFLIGAYYFWFFTPSPFNLIGGLPLFMLGLAFALLGPLDFLEILTSARTRRGICPFCQPVTLRDFFVPNTINPSSHKASEGQASPSREASEGQAPTSPAS